MPARRAGFIDILTHSMKVLASSISETRSKSILFPVLSDTGADVTPALREVLTKLAKQGGGRLEFSPGQSARLVPQGGDVTLEKSGDRVTLRVPVFSCHQMIEIEC